MGCNTVSDTIRNINIDILRLIFALFIVFYHIRYVVHAPIYDFPQNGYLAVDFFFIVSGYLIVKSCRDNEEKGTETGTLRYCFHKLMSFLPYLIIAEIFFGMVEGSRTHFRRVGDDDLELVSRYQGRGGIKRG